MLTGNLWSNIFIIIDHDSKHDMSWYVGVGTTQGLLSRVRGAVSGVGQVTSYHSYERKAKHQF